MPALEYLNWQMAICRKKKFQHPSVVVSLKSANVYLTIKYDVAVI